MSRSVRESSPRTNTGAHREVSGAGPRRFLAQARSSSRRVASKTDNDLAVDDGDWRRHPSDLLQFLERGLVCRDISFDEGHALLLKVPLQLRAEQSTRLSENRH